MARKGRGRGKRRKPSATALYRLKRIRSNLLAKWSEDREKAGLLGDMKTARALHEKIMTKKKAWKGEYYSLT